MSEHILSPDDGTLSLETRCEYKKRSCKEGNFCKEDTEGNFNNLIVHATWRPQQLRTDYNN